MRSAPQGVGPADSADDRNDPVVGTGTLRELFAFGDWAREKLMAVSALLSESELDQKFEMGEGSVRATLNHLWAAERVWLDRWLQRPPSYRTDSAGVSLAQLDREFRESATERNAFVDGLREAELRARLTYTNLRGETITLPVGGTILHLCNHGSHHRAQAVNMLRRVGKPVPPPGVDYIFMKLEQPGSTPCELDVSTLRSYFAYGDWANARVLREAAQCTDDQLNRAFELGLGTLRKTLVHIRDAEQWWLANWKEGSGRMFPSADVNTSVSRIAALWRETVANRNQFIAGLADTDLKRMVVASPRPQVVRNCPLGVTMLQLGHHGTHHRAQAANMLRHLGAKVPALDWALKLRESYP